MVSYDRLSSLIADVAKRSGLPLELDALGSCAIQYNDVSEIVRTACDEGESVLLHAPLTFLCEQRPLAHLRHCMELTLYGATAQYGALGLDPDSDGIVFWRRMALADVDSHRLENTIVDFIADADKLRTLLAERHESSGDDDDGRDTTQNLNVHATLIRI